MTKREDFKNEFKALIVETVLTHGAAVSLTANEYGWHDYDADNHIKGKASSRARHAGEPDPEPCAWVPTKETNFTEEHVYEFGDTYNGSEKTFINVKNVNCKCGEYVDRAVRYEGKTMEFIPLMFMEESQFLPTY